MIFVKFIDVFVIDNENNVVVVEFVMIDLNLDLDRKLNFEFDRKYVFRKNFFKLNKEFILDLYLDFKDVSGVINEFLVVDFMLLL